MNQRRLIFALCLVCLGLADGSRAGAGGASAPLSDREFADKLFAGKLVARLEIEIPPRGVEELTKRDSDGRRRPSTLVTVREGGGVFTNVTLHLKGGAGSYRPLNDNPAVTLNFEKFAPGQTFHGLKKLSLNNSVQDPSFLNEMICRELFNAAGTPAPRAAFATLRLNGRDLGLRVLTEGFNKQFLRRHFKNVHGNLYQTHGNQEITDNLDVNSGDVPTNYAGLQALASAAAESDPSARWNRLRQTLDIDRFISFMAMEVIVCHWDGYCMNQNNYRVFHDLGSNKIVFIAHGMDQMFGLGSMLLGGVKSSSDCPIFPPMQGLVAQAVIRTPEGRQLYRERLAALSTNLFRAQSVVQRVDDLAAVVRPVIAEQGSDASRAYDARVENLKEHIKQRSLSLERQLALAARPRVPGSNDVIRLAGWTVKFQQGQPEFDHQGDPAVGGLLHIAVPHGSAAGSWRTRLRLEPGSYRFVGRVRTRDVQPENHGAGAALRISGGQNDQRTTGTADWRQVSYEFEASGEGEIEFVCELKASRGEAWFDPDSLRVVPVP